MKKNALRKLSLSRETLRSLQDSPLQKVAAGQSGDDWHCGSAPCDPCGMSDSCPTGGSGLNTICC